MYPWVTHTHNHLGGECQHRCTYCYVDSPRFGRPDRYSGPIRLIEEELSVNYGCGRTIFIECMNDLFAEDVPELFVRKILLHCRNFLGNTYVFQTKNPWGFYDYVNELPIGSLIGTTIETNRSTSRVSAAPIPAMRCAAMCSPALRLFQRFVTIEPILSFDLDELVEWIVNIAPEFVNIGADSKNHGLPEPTGAEVTALIAALKDRGITVREKQNLKRLLAV